MKLKKLNDVGETYKTYMDINLRNFENFESLGGGSPPNNKEYRIHWLFSGDLGSGVSLGNRKNWKGGIEEIKKDRIADRVDITLFN